LTDGGAGSGGGHRAGEVGRRILVISSAVGAASIRRDVTTPAYVAREPPEPLDAFDLNALLGP